MIIVEQVDWLDAKDDIRLVREKVFIIEQGIDFHQIEDEKDPLAFHVIARNNRGEAIGVGRLTQSGHLGKVSVTIPYRGKGIGNQILYALIGIARENKFPHLHLNSQTHALEFYEKAGFTSEGPVFMQAGVPHKRMEYAF